MITCAVCITVCMSCTAVLGAHHLCMQLFRTDLVNTAKAAQEFILKNRYGNIFACESLFCTAMWVCALGRHSAGVRCLVSLTDDHARVVMKDPDEEGCDYINASYMDVSAIRWLMCISVFVELV